MKATKAIYFENLDALRAIAFGLVFLFHFFGYMSFSLSSDFGKGLTRFMAEGHLGVNLFFVLSGFLITYLLIAEKEQNGKINIRYFYIRRILRIWPLYFLVILISFFVYPFITHQFTAVVTKDHLPWYALLLNNFDRIYTDFAGTGHDNPGVLWSVAVEEQFYLFWPLVLSVTNKKYYVALFLAVIVASLAYRYANHTSESKLYFHTFSVMSDLAVGALLAYVGFYKTKIFSLLESCKKTLIISMYLTLFIIVFFIQDWARSSTFSIVVERLVLSVFFAFIIGEQCYSKNSLFKLKSLKYLGKAGIISYGLYCLHLYSFVLIQKFNAVGGIHQLSIAMVWVEFFVSLAVSVLLAYLSYRYFEKKFLNLKSSFITV